MSRARIQLRTSHASRGRQRAAMTPTTDTKTPTRQHAWASLYSGGPSRPPAAAEPGVVRANVLGAVRQGSKNVSPRSEEHTSELQSHVNLVCRLLLEKKKPATCN